MILKIAKVTVTDLESLQSLITRGSLQPAAILETKRHISTFMKSLRKEQFIYTDVLEILEKNKLQM